MLFLVTEWSVSEVKEWVFELFGSEEIACKFEEEEIDGRILLSSTVRSNEALEKLGLCTIGKKGKVFNFLTNRNVVLKRVITSHCFDKKHQMPCLHCFVLLDQSIPNVPIPLWAFVGL